VSSGNHSQNTGDGKEWRVWPQERQDFFWKELRTTDAQLKPICQTKIGKCMVDFQQGSGTVVYMFNDRKIGNLVGASRRIAYSGLSKRKNEKVPVMKLIA